jgi:hypothetical protein
VKLRIFKERFFIFSISVMPIESFIKNPSTFLKASKDYSSFKAPLTVQTPYAADPRQVQIARNELEALCKKPARTEDEK